MNDRSTEPPRIVIVEDEFVSLAEAQQYDARPEEYSAVRLRGLIGHLTRAKGGELCR